MPYKRLKSRDTYFFFKYEDDYPDLLHIWARHLKETDDAIYIYFEGKSQWNQIHQRFETRLDGECIYWFWKNQSKKEVIVISCFDEIESKTND